MGSESVPRRLRFQQLALDILAGLALAGTGEVSLPWLGALSLVWLYSGVARRRVRDRTGLWLLFLAIVGTIAWIWIRSVPPILAAAFAAPGVHALVVLCADTRRWRNWRLSLCLLEIMLAASLSPDLYLSGVIVLFACLAVGRSVSEFAQSAIENGPAPVAVGREFRRAMRRATWIAVGLLFATAAVIFPFLPRAMTSLRAGDSPSGEAKVGYSEDVNVGGWMKLTGKPGTGGVAVRLFFPKDFPQNGVWLGLIRGRVLDRFDGESWKVPVRHSAAEAPRTSPAAAQVGRFEIEAIREPLGSDVVPIPYGAVNLRRSSVMGTEPLRKGSRSEYASPGITESRLRYFFGLEREYLPGEANWAGDFPQPENLEVPRAIRDSKFPKLAAQIFNNSQSVTERVRALKNYFAEQKFSAGLGADVDAEATSRIAARTGLSRLESFLLVERTGHCELFATSYALLLRLGRVPTRLVAGFRVIRPVRDGVLTVYQGDAHAWLEYWDPARGWLALDATPKVYFQGGMFDTISEHWETLSALWYKNVLSYGEEDSGKLTLKMWEFSKQKAEQLRHPFSWPKPVQGALLFCFLGIITYRARRYFRRHERGPRASAALRRWIRAREALESSLSRELALAPGGTLGHWETALRVHRGLPAVAAYQEWRTLYEARRFGPHPPDETDLQRLEAQRLRVLAA